MSTEKSDVLTLQELVQNVEKAANDFTALSLEVSAHRAALGDARERLIVIREPMGRWEKALWETSWQFEERSDRQVWLGAHGKARDLNILIDRQIWQLFDFRKPVAEGGAPP